MDSVDCAWAVLNSAFGDPSRVLAAKKAKLRELGKFPGDSNTAKGFEKQIEWCLHSELAIQGLIDLGERDPTMEYESFSQSTIHSRVNMIPPRIMSKMLEGGLMGRDQLEKIREVIVDLRKKAQSLLKCVLDRPVQSSSKDTATSAGVGGSAGPDRASRQRIASVAMVTYKQTQRD